MKSKNKIFSNNNHPQLFSPSRPREGEIEGEGSIPIVKIFFISIVLLFTAASCNRPAVVEESQVVLAGKTINVEIADDNAERGLGLSGRYTLADDSGMLFVFDAQSRPAFWMKGMKFPIDIIWISGGTVVDITHSAPVEPDIPDEKLNVYKPKALVDNVLELPAGWSVQNDLKIGDSVSIK